MVRTELVIASGTTETVASGVTQDTATVSNAGTFSNAGTNTAGGQELTTTAVDIDASSITLTRVRSLTTIGLPTLNIRQGDTEVVDANVTETSGEVKNAGTLANGGTFKTGVEGPTAVDIDAAATDVFAGHFLSGEGVDVNQSNSILSRNRILSTTALDVDFGISTLLPKVSLAATATDIATTNAVLNRVRSLTTLDTSILSIDSGDTRIVNSGDTLNASTVANAGTLSNQGTIQTQDPVRASNTNNASVQLTRKFDLAAKAIDIDSAQTPLLIEVSLIASATDIDSSVNTLLRIVSPDTTAIPRTQPVETIKDVLEKTDGVWRAEEPIVKNYWDEAQSERGQAAGQPPKLYVWQPASESHDKFSLDGDTSDDSVTIEVLIYSLDEIEAKRYAADVRGILQLYINENKDLTQYTDIKPVATNDYRQQSNHRATDQYVLSVEVDMRTLQETGDLGQVD